MAEQTVRCGHPECDLHQVTPNHWQCNGWCEPYEPGDDIGPPKLSRIEDLLTPEEQAKLHADLAEMARKRRRAEAESAGIWMP